MVSTFIIQTLTPWAIWERIIKLKPLYQPQLFPSALMLPWQPCPCSPTPACSISLPGEWRRVLEQVDGKRRQ